MNKAAFILLVMFCALLSVQVACATGWQVHGACAEEAPAEDHCESCHWDPCRLNYHSPVKSKVGDTQTVSLPIVCVSCERPTFNQSSVPFNRVAPPGATTPRPAGDFPLLI